MAAPAEIKSLQKEYDWLLKHEVNRALAEIQSILLECSRRFQIDIENGHEMSVKSEKFMLAATGSQQVKCMATLAGDHITEAEVQLKTNKQQQGPFKTSLSIDHPWKLQQIQDAGNHLSQAIAHIQGREPESHFQSGHEALQHLNAIISCVSRGKASVTIPKKKGLDDLVHHTCLRWFVPALPTDTVFSFYVQGSKLVLAVYQLFLNSKQQVDIAGRFSGDCEVPWLRDTLLLFNIALHECQVLKNKIAIFVEYEDAGTLEPPDCEPSPFL